MAQTNNYKKCLYLTFIVDRSGSMMSCGVAVFEGIRNCIEKKAQFAQKQDMSLCLTIFTFDDTIERLEIPSDPTKLTKEHYQIIKDGVEPRGWTRLYDTIHQAAIYTTKLQEKQGQPNSRGFMVIITDGEDNLSDITHNDLKKEIESHQKTGMEYIFIGANINARNTGSALGISPNACIQFSPVPQLTQTAFSNLGMAIQRSIETDDGEFKFSQLERQTSCTASDCHRFQVDAEADIDPDAEADVEHTNIFNNVYNTTYDYPDDGDPLFSGDILANGVNDLFNMSFINEKQETKDKTDADTE